MFVITLMNSGIRIRDWPEDKLEIVKTIGSTARGAASVIDCAQKKANDIGKTRRSSKNGVRKAATKGLLKHSPQDSVRLNK